ncbi:MAG: hypothetical protein ACRD2W_17005 [Acidimicrobiales bacterium]
MAKLVRSEDDASTAADLFGEGLAVAAQHGCWLATAERRRRYLRMVQLYHGMSSEFISDTAQNQITAKLQRTFEQQYQYQAPQSEVRSWQNSLRAMSSALQLGGFTDHGIALEWQLPLSSKRLDVMVTGQDHGARANAVIVELKQWEETERSYVDDCVVTFVGGRLRDQLHPSKQVGNYQRYLQDVHTVFSNAVVGLQACSYLHNLAYAESTELFDPRHGHLLATNPVFAGDQVDGLADHAVVQREGAPGRIRTSDARFRNGPNPCVYMG